MAFTHALSTNNYGPAQFIVSASAANGTHTTIALALADASSGDTIFIRTGTYTENITMVAGVNLTGYVCDGFSANVIILGKITMDVTGNCALSGLTLNTNTANAISVEGSGVSKLFVVDCTINGIDATAINVNNASCGVRFLNCKLTTTSNNLNFNISATLGVDFRNSEISAGTAANTVSTFPSVNLFQCKTEVFSVTTTSTGAITANNCYLTNNSENQTFLTMAGTGSSRIANCAILSGTASTIVIGTGCTVNVTNCAITSSNTNVFTGLGTVNTINNGCTSSSGNDVSTINTLTSI